jgi:hypothetical protein
MPIPREFHQVPAPRIWSHCCFRYSGTEYVSESGIKWMSGGKEVELAQWDEEGTAAFEPPCAEAAGRECSGNPPNLDIVDGPGRSGAVKRP